MPFGLSCSVVRPVIPLLKAGRHDFELLNLFRQRGDLLPSLGKSLNQKKTELKYVVAKIALLIRAFSRAPLMFRPQGDDSESSLYHWRLMNPTREVHPFHIHQVHFLVYRVGGNPVRNPAWVDTVNVPTAAQWIW
jgi:hypothetical protein